MMHDVEGRRYAGRQQLSAGRAAGVRPAPLDIRTSVAVDYWVIDETGRLADPDCTAMLPGATVTDSPWNVTVETPLCGSCGELQDALETRLRRTVTAAHDRGCRLLALGLRPDLLAERPRTQKQPPPETAGTRISFEADPTAVADIYDVLLALDPAFVLVNTTRWDGGCGRPASRRRQRRQQGVAASRSVDAGESTERPTTADWQPIEEAPTATEWQPVELFDDRVIWRSLDPAPPTLLVDLTADVRTVLQTANTSRVETDSFGNGVRADRLVLPDAEWRALYTREAVEKGLSSLLVRAYLERFGIDTDWYRGSRPPPVRVQSSTALSAVCRRRAADLEADIGLRGMR